MSLRQLKFWTIALPTLLIGGFEYARHDWLEHYLSMETGNLYITLLTLLLAYLFATWVFGRFEQINQRLAEEQAKRAVYEERERLARELHDNIAQTLFFTGVMLNQGKIEEARSAVSDIDQQVRQAIFNLRTASDRSLDFATRLTVWLREWSSLSGMEAMADIRVSPGSFTQAEELQLFAIVQEAFTNIRKHSHAESATLKLTGGSDGWELIIEDDGTGLQPEDQSAKESSEASGSAGGSYGLELMRRRSRELGAQLHVISPVADGRGTRIKASCQRRREP
ncbi:sensor histidine kinase [Paenibacillus chartarius]|uniref:histidine kinase n=2 Tax=Paenibacillus chartarius TaxID=747481 RepID=A0ABV6DMX8_9BACL